MSLRRLLLALSISLLLTTTCSCGVVGPAGAVIGGIIAASGGGGGGAKPVPPAPLAVSLGTYTPAGATVMYNASDVLAVQLKLTNNLSVDVDVSSITLSGNGTVKDDDDFSAVKLYADVDQNGQLSGGDVQLGGNQTFSADNGSAVFSFAARTIVQGDSEFYIAIVDLAGTADHNENFRIGVAQPADVTAQETISADPVSVGGPPVYGNLFTIQGVGQLEVAVGSNSPSPGGVPEGSTGVEMLQLRVTAGNAEPIALNSLTITASRLLNDATAITSVELYLDANGNGNLDVGFDSQIDTDKTYAVDNGTVNFTLTGKTLAAGQTENWLIVYDLTSPLTPNDTFQVRLLLGTHISGTGTISSTAALIVGTPVDGPVMYIQGIGTLTAASAASPPDSYVPFVGEWPVLHLTLAAGPNEPVDVTSITVNQIGTGPVTTSDVSAVRLYHDVNANGRYDSYTDLLLASGTYSGSAATLSSFTLTCTENATTHALVQYVMAGNTATTSGLTHEVTINPAAEITAVGHDTSASIPVAGSVPGPTMTILRDAWLPMSASGLAGRCQHVMVSTGTDVIIWGGRSSGTYYQDGAIYHPLEDTWDAVGTSGRPSARSSSAAAWTGTKAFVWGGYSGSGYLGDGGLYDPDANSWETVNSTNAPASRMDAVCVWSGTSAVVWGGYAGGFLETGGVYNLTGGSWTATDTAGIYAPSGRRYMTADWNGSGMIVWGGYNNISTYLNDGAIYSPFSYTWSGVSSAGAPEARQDHTGVQCGSRHIIWGGFNSTNLYLSNGAYYQSGAWTDINTGAPAGRSQHSAVWSGRYMIVWGGRDVSVPLQTGGRIDPDTRTWTATTTTGAPTARRIFGAVWTGAGMIVWGGSTGASGFIGDSSGGRYLP